MALASTSHSVTQSLNETPSSSIGNRTEFAWKLAELFSSSTDEMRKSNRETYLHLEIQMILAKMALLPPTHDLHLDEEVARRASSFASWLHSNTTAPAPKIINEDGEAVLFTWLDRCVKTYISVDAEDVDAEARTLGEARATKIDFCTGTNLDPAKLSTILRSNLKSNVDG